MGTDEVLFVTKHFLDTEIQHLHVWAHCGKKAGNIK